MTTSEAYAVLRTHPDAPAEVVVAAYRARLSEVHPDHGGSPGDFIALREAWAVVKAAEERKAAELAKCPACEGSGECKVKSGWHVLTMPCAACRGTGRR